MMWREIAREWESKIVGRELALGDRLPTERELCKRYMVTRATVQRAFRQLEHQGLIESTQGRGRFVSRLTDPFLFTLRVQSGDARGITWRFSTAAGTGLPRQRIDADMVRALLVDADQHVFSVERTGIYNDEPVAFVATYVLVATVPGLSDAFRTFGTLRKSAQACGIEDFLIERTQISARVATPADAELLHVPAHVPLLVARSTLRLRDGTPLGYNFTTLPVDRAEFEVYPSQEDVVTSVAPRSPTGRSTS